MTEETTTKRARKARATTPAQEAKAVKAAAAPKEKKDETVQQLKNRLRNEAEREVLNAHKDEVITKTEAKYKEHGLEYVRRLSDEEKAAKEIADNLEKYPGLREQMMRQLAEEQMRDRLSRAGVDSNGDALLAAGPGPIPYTPAFPSAEPADEAADAAEAGDVEHREGE